ncbi:MAG: hypothetical protein AB1625_08645 [Acidobacteriota bacterium]
MGHATAARIWRGVVAVAVVAGAMVVAPAASAHDRNDQWRRDDRDRHERRAPYRHDHRWSKAPHGHGLVAVRVPARIARHERHLWAPYRVSRVYDARHRNVHEVYSFPVWVGGRVVLQPYHYRDGHLVVRGGHGGVRLNLHLGF